jgi:hypothetical protein
VAEVLTLHKARERQACSHEAHQNSWFQAPEQGRPAAELLAMDVIE